MPRSRDDEFHERLVNLEKGLHERVEELVEEQIAPHIDRINELEREVRWMAKKLEQRGRVTLLDGDRKK